MISLRFSSFALALLCLAPQGEALAQSDMLLTPTRAFVDNGNGTVTHSLTGLTWMRCALGQTWSGIACSGTPRGFSWVEAQEAASTTTWAGHTDWRVPSPWELSTIVQYGRKPAHETDRALINSEVFPGGVGNAHWFWTSLSVSGVNSDAWDIGFANDEIFGGVLTPVAKTDRDFVRLVRGGSAADGFQTPTSDFIDHSDGTVTHKKTGLTWKRCLEGQTWTGSACSGSPTYYAVDEIRYKFLGNEGGPSLPVFPPQTGTGWRVPNPQELFSIIEYARSSPALNQAIFPDETGKSLFVRFWSDAMGDYNLGGIDSATGGGPDEWMALLNPIRLVSGIQSPNVGVVPVSLEIVGPAEIAGGSPGNLYVRAKYDDGSFKGVRPTWTSSHPAILSISEHGSIQTFVVQTNTPVTVTATYTEAGKTLVQSHTITVTSEAAVLSALSLELDKTVLQAGESSNVWAKATYSDGSIVNNVAAGATWVTSNPAVLSVIPAQAGCSTCTPTLKAADSVATESVVTVTVNYTHNGITKTSARSVTVKPKAGGGGTPGLRIEGPTVIAYGETAQYTLFRIEGGSKIPEDARWHIEGSPRGISITGDGVVSVSSTVSSDLDIVVIATFRNDAGAALTESLTVQIRADASSGSFRPQWGITESGPLTQYTLKGRLSVTDPAEVGKTGVTYVAAEVPHVGYFVLSGQKGWESWDMKSSLSNYGMGPLGNHTFDVILNVDMTKLLGESLSGTKVFIGYGVGASLSIAQKDMLDRSRVHLLKVF
jgi:hypothetical protein